MTLRSSVATIAACASTLILVTGTARAISLPDSGSCNDSRGDCLTITNTSTLGGVSLRGAGTGAAVGIVGSSSSNVAISGTSTSNTGISGETNSANAFGVEGINLSTSGFNGAAIYGNTAFNTTVTWAGLFDGDVGAANYYSVSDRRLKKDIRDAPYGLNEILKLHPVTFKWDRPKNERVEIGFIAQEVRAVMPEAVIARGPDAKLSLNYNALMPAAIKAIQEQQKIIDAQAARISRLEQHRTSTMAAMLSDNWGVTSALLLAAAVGVAFHRRRGVPAPRHDASPTE